MSRYCCGWLSGPLETCRLSLLSRGLSLGGDWSESCHTSLVFGKERNQSILKEIIPEYSLEGLMLKLQYFGHLMQRSDSLEKTLMLEKMAGRRRRGRQDVMVGWHHQLNRHECEQTPGDSEGQESLACCSPWGHKA